MKMIKDKNTNDEKPCNCVYIYISGLANKNDYSFICDAIY